MPEELICIIESTFTEAKIQYSPVSNGTNLTLIQSRKVVLVKEIPIVPVAAITNATFEKRCIAVYHNCWITMKIKNDEKEDGKDISLSKIEEVRVSTFTFEYPKSFDLKRYSNLSISQKQTKSG